MRALTTLLALVSLPTLAAGLNDTGQIYCYDASNIAVVCSSAGVGSDAGVNPRQDARFGRDAKNAAGTLTKVGGGAAGFDFTKIANNGTVLAADAAQGSGATDWACTKDNHTNLIWSLQTVSAIDWVHANDIFAGSPIAAHNAATRCGFGNGWRVPFRHELLSIVHSGASSPAIDATYFPGTASGYGYWTWNAYAPDPAFAWLVSFYHGESYADSKSLTGNVRLVRSGP